MKLIISILLTLTLLLTVSCGEIQSSVSFTKSKYYIVTGSGTPNYYADNIEINGGFLIIHGFYNRDGSFNEEDIILSASQIIRIENQ